MSVWNELRGQEHAIEVFRAAVESARPTGATSLGDGAEAGDGTERAGDANVPRASGRRNGMTNSWLITGPAGSGRSTMAYAFAAALLCEHGGCGVCNSCVQVQSRSHPDLTAVVTETVQLDIRTARDLVDRAALSPMVSPYRVIVVEDADRMVARTSNTLLKAIEEPPATTVWVLCAPSEADLLPTIRSRVRSVGLRVPPIDDVARLLAERDGIAMPDARRAAREAQSHIGMARRLATSPEAWARRDASLDGVLTLRTTGDAVRKAAQLISIADEDSTAQSADRDERERADALRSLGIEPGQAVPRQLRSMVKDLEDHQKRRAKRAQVDAVDRILTDLQSLVRDVLMVQLGNEVELVNERRRDEIESAARAIPAEHSLRSMDAIRKARAHIAANVPPVLALEGLLIAMTPRVEAATR